ncbi:hypothetical protein GCM10029963_44990 [Micromonospora andamanensis]
MQHGQHDRAGEGHIDPPDLGDDQGLALLDLAEQSADHEHHAERDEQDDGEEYTYTSGDDIHGWGARAMTTGRRAGRTPRILLSGRLRGGMGRTGGRGRPAALDGSGVGYSGMCLIGSKAGPAGITQKNSPSVS